MAASSLAAKDLAAKDTSIFIWPERGLTAVIEAW
jgi:hypothetical protein